MKSTAAWPTFRPIVHRAWSRSVISTVSTSDTGQILRRVKAIADEHIWNACALTFDPHPTRLSRRSARRLF